MKLDPTAPQSFPLHMQLRLSLMAERHIQISEISLLQVNLCTLFSDICAWLNIKLKKKLTRDFRRTIILQHDKRRNSLHQSPGVC